MHSDPSKYDYIYMYVIIFTINQSYFKSCTITSCRTHQRHEDHYIHLLLTVHQKQNTDLSWQNITFEYRVHDRLAQFASYIFDSKLGV
jgi:hypothetical protein